MTTTTKKYNLGSNHLENNMEYYFLPFVRMKEHNKKHWNNQKRQTLKESSKKSKDETFDLGDEGFVYF
ncbi:hypothetical protein J4232_00870 [Candidatus Woesearchaeota archaeon]|nr:hypothetical protein [Candidatus Woesearchaeota archaeon]